MADTVPTASPGRTAAAASAACDANPAYWDSNAMSTNDAASRE